MATEVEGPEKDYPVDLSLLLGTGASPSTEQEATFVAICYQ